MVSAAARTAPEVPRPPASDPPIHEDGQVSISRRGMLAAGLTAAVVGSIGVASMINAAADETADAPVAVAPAADDNSDGVVAGDDGTEVIVPPTNSLPWGERPKHMRVGRIGASSAELAAEGLSAARDDTSRQPTPEFGPKGRAFRNGRVLSRQETTIVPPPLPPTAAEPVGGAKDVYYLYSLGKQNVQADGAAANITIGKPKVAKEDWHSLAEIAVQSADGSQVVEVGWTVDRITNGDEDPHLFVFSWVDGVPTCYNQCNFVPAKGASIKPGDTLVQGTTKNFGIQHIGDAWWIAYDSEWIGAFLDKSWDGDFTQAGLVQFFGEVAASNAKPCTQMGNGLTPDNISAARFGSVMYVNGPPVALDVKSTSDVFSSNKLSDRTFRYGGPGAC
jgi:neprosin-like protein